MSTLLNVLIDDIVEMNNEKEFEEIKMEVLSEIASIENEDIAFESIVKGDNFVRRFVSKIGKFISTYNDNGSKIKFDLNVFKSINKSKISKDVTGVATPEYVKTFTDIMLNEPSYNKSDVDRLIELTSKVGISGNAKSALSKMGSALAAGAAWYYTLTYIFLSASKYNFFMAISMDIIGIALRIYSNKSLKYTVNDMSTDEVNEMLDIVAKLLNSFLGINSTSISNKSYENADDIIRVLSNKTTTTITVADQNKVADMLLELVNKFKDSKYDSVKFNLSKSNMTIFKEFIKDVKSGDVKDISEEILKKMENILTLANKIDSVALALAEASNTIMRDIRKW